MTVSSILSRFNHVRYLEWVTCLEVWDLLKKAALFFDKPCREWVTVSLARREQSVEGAEGDACLSTRSRGLAAKCL